MIGLAIVVLVFGGVIILAILGAYFENKESINDMQDKGDSNSFD